MKRDFLITAMREILASIQAGKPLADVLQEILRSACRLTNSIHGSFVTVNHDKGELIISCVHGPDWSEEKKAFVVKVGQGITGHVAATGKPYLCSDTSTDRRYAVQFDFVKSKLVVPVFVEKRVWGIINLDGLKKNAYDRKVLPDMELFAQLASEAIDMRLRWGREQRLQHELMQAEKLSSFGRLLSGFAHEINNPLAAIMGGASVLAYDASDPVQKQTLDAIASEAQRAADLVKNLIAFSRRQTVEKERREINVLIRDATSMVRHQLKQKGIRLRLSLPENSPVAEVHPLQMQQVLLGLLSNAENAIEKEGRPDGDILIDVSESGGMVQIEIADNGIGMEAETRRSIYDPFFTTQEVGKGSGMGLSIAHDIITAHGGSINCRSVLHSGTVFNIQMPACTEQGQSRTEVMPEPEVKSRGAAEKGEGTGAGGLRVLIVDDEEPIRKAIARFLNFKGMNVTEAVDGVEAQRLAHAQDFDMVLSDVRMPRMDGFDLYRALNEINEHYNRRFIFMTGNRVASETSDLIRKTRCPCIEKPFQLEAMLNLIHQQRGQPNGDGQAG